MAQGNKAQKQIMAAIYERSDGRKLWPLRIQRSICTSLKRKAIKEHFVKKSSAPENPKGVLECVSTLSSWQNKAGKWHHYQGKQCCYKWQKGNRWTIQCTLYSNCWRCSVDDRDRYGQHFENHPSIIAIHEKNRARDGPLCFTFEHINRAQLERALLDVNVRKSCDHDMLFPRLVKESASVIAKPITNILNTSAEQGCYPNAWKKGQVTPLFKKDDESNKANYRPVTVLPVLHNIYERLLAVQLREFYCAIAVI